MSNNDTMIFEDSPDAARFATGIEGWVSRDGFFCGKNERMARYSGATHRRCEKHGPFAKNSYCRQCADEKEAAEYATYPRKTWEGEPLYCQANDKWFMDADDLYCHLTDDDDVSPDEVLENMRLVIGEPVYASEVDPVDLYQDDLPEDADDVPAAIREAFDALNAVIRAHKEPLSYLPSKMAADVSLADVGITTASADSSNEGEP